MREMERKTRLARLIVAAPEMVFAELKAYSADLKGPPYTIPDEDIEAALAERNNPLIDLGLASYGGSPKIVGEMYRKGKAPADDARDQQFKKGLRLAVLGNETVSNDSSCFPEHSLGAEEVAHVMVSAEPDEPACSSAIQGSTTMCSSRSTVARNGPGSWMRIVAAT